MKKIIPILLSILMVVSLAACAGNSNNTPESRNGSNSAKVQQPGYGNNNNYGKYGNPGYGNNSDYSGYGSYRNYNNNSNKSKAVCPVCNGGKKKCSSCNGSGTLSRTKYAPNFGYGGDTSYQIKERCKACNGTGQMDCLHCVDGYLQ